MFFLRWYSWVVPNVLLAFCLYGILRKYGYRVFPWFTSYLAFELIHFLISFFVVIFLRRFTWGFSLYRALLDAEVGLSAILALGVIYELANELIVSRSRFSHALRSLLRWTIVALVMVAAASSAMFPVAKIGRLMGAFQVLDFSSSLIKVGLLLFLLLFARTLQISLRSLPAGIALGFAISASVSLGASSLVSSLGHTFFITLDLVRLLAFHVCVLVWLVYIFLPEKTRSTRPMDQSELELWKQEINRMVQP